MAVLTCCWLTDALIIIASLLSILLYLLTRNFNYWNKRGVPQIPPLRFSYNFVEWFLPRVPTGFIVKRLYEESDNLPYVGFYIFERPMLMARDPEIVKHVLVKDWHKFEDRLVHARRSDVLGWANLFSLKQPAWKILRNKLTPLFTTAKLRKIFELLMDVGSDLDSFMTDNVTDVERSLNMKEICAKYTTDAISATAFGTRANSLKDPEAEFRKYGGRIFDFQLFHGFEAKAITFSPTLVNLLGLSFFEKTSMKFLRKAFWDIAKQREASGDRRHDLVDLLMEQKRNQEANPDQTLFPFEGDHLVAQAAIFFGAGYESSSSAMFFTLYELALQPELQTKLRNEINEAIEKNGSKITYDLISSITYLNMVLSETLRKYPALPVLDRVANEDYKLPGYDLVIEKGTPVVIPMLGLHYDPEYFPNPDKFDPERFSEENVKNRNPYVYLPFGDGPHVCIGVRLANLQSKLGLIHLISKYEFSPNEKTLIPMKYDAKGHLITCVNGLYLNVKRVNEKTGIETNL